MAGAHSFHVLPSGELSGAVLFQDLPFWKMAGAYSFHVLLSGELSGAVLFQDLLFWKIAGAKNASPLPYW